MDFLLLGAGQQGSGKKRTKDDQDLELGCLGENALNAKVETNLAQPDPWILPILAGLATFASFFFTPTPSQGGMNDIMQKMMKYVFPIMIMWLAKSYPAGLALYWFVSQFLQIFFNIRFEMLKKQANEEKDGKKKRKPVRAGKGVN